MADPSPGLGVQLAPSAGGPRHSNDATDIARVRGRIPMLDRIKELGRQLTTSAVKVAGSVKEGAGTVATQATEELRTRPIIDGPVTLTPRVGLMLTALQMEFVMHPGTRVQHVPRSSGPGSGGAREAPPVQVTMQPGTAPGGDTAQTPSACRPASPSAEHPPTA